MCLDAHRSSNVFLLYIIALLFVSAFILVGCGGTSSSTPTNNQPAVPAPSASQPPPGGSNSGGSAGTGNSGGSTGGSSGGSTSGGTGASGESATTAIAYVGGSNNTFYGIRVDRASNVSTVSGSPHSLPGSANTFATSGNLLFVSSTSSDFSSGTITGFRADANGALAQLGSTAVKSQGGTMIALDSSGKFLYATASLPNGGPAFTSGAVFGFSVDQNSGTLNALPGSPWYLTGGMGPPSKPKVSASGSWLCVDMYFGRTNDGVQCYARHPDGTIDGSTYVQPAASNIGIAGLAITADSTHIIYTGGAQSVFSALISKTQNVNAVSSGGSGASAVSIDPTGHWAAVTNSGSDNLAIFSFGAGDNLTAAGTPASTPSHTTDVAFSRSGAYVFVASQNGTIVFSFNPSTGAVTALNASNPGPGQGSIATM